MMNGLRFRVYCDVQWKFNAMYNVTFFFKMLYNKPYITTTKTTMNHQ